jgi:hypothetical protein
MSGNKVVSFDAGGVSPIRLLGPGANLANPSFSDLIFDGNQQPLRVKQLGTVVMSQGAGFFEGIGTYAGQSVPIANPDPNKRHLAICLGNAGSSVSTTRQTPGMSGSSITGGSFSGQITWFQNEGIGVGTDATNVWCLSNYGSTPQFAQVGTIHLYIPGFPYGHYVDVGVLGVVGFTPRPATISYLVFHNTIG